MVQLHVPDTWVSGEYMQESQFLRWVKACARLLNLDVSLRLAPSSGTFSQRRLDALDHSFDQMVYS